MAEAHRVSVQLMQPLRCLAGHSHYHNIRHRKAAVDAKRQAYFGRLSREIRSAIRVAGAETSGNPRLTRAIESAKRGGMPKERIERMVKDSRNRASTAQLALFEAVLPGGVGLLIRACSERKAGIAGELRSMVSRAGGEFGKALWMFEDRVSVMVRGGEDVALAGIEEGADDVIETGEGVELLCSAGEREALRKGILERVAGLGEGDVVVCREFRPTGLVQVDENGLEKLTKLFEKLDEHAEVVEYVHNAEMGDGEYG